MSTLEDLFGRFGDQIAQASQAKEDQLCRHVLAARARARKQGHNPSEIEKIVCKFDSRCTEAKCKLERNNPNLDWPRTS